MLSPDTYDIKLYTGAPKGTETMSEFTKVMMVQRCGKHPSANVIMQRDGSFTCILCGKKLKTDSIDPPTNER